MLALVHSAPAETTPPVRPALYLVKGEPPPVPTRWWCGACPAELFTDDDVAASLPTRSGVPLLLCHDCSTN